LIQSKAVESFVDTKSYWWCQKSALENDVLAPLHSSWSEVRGDLISNGIVEGKIRNVRYFLHVSDPELADDAARSSPESHRNFAAHIVSVWPRQRGRSFVRLANLQQHFEALESPALGSLLEGIEKVGRSAYPGETLSQVIPCDAKGLACLFIALHLSSRRPSSRASTIFNGEFTPNWSMWRGYSCCELW
jgi:hypothetical protein